MSLQVAEIYQIPIKLHYSLVLVFFLTAYIFIPSQFTISNIVLVKANSNSVYRCLTNETSWGNFFGEKIKNNNFKRGNTIFKVNKQCNFF